MTPIKYIGRRAFHTDNLYGTKANWQQNETILIEDDIVARKMLRHPDVYALGALDAEAPKTVEAPAGMKVAKVVDADPSGKKEEDLQHARDLIATMPKTAIVDYARTHFAGHQIDGRVSLDAMRRQVIGMIDQFGID